MQRYTGWEKNRSRPEQHAREGAGRRLTVTNSYSSFCCCRSAFWNYPSPKYRSKWVCASHNIVHSICMIHEIYFVSNSSSLAMPHTLLSESQSLNKKRESRFTQKKKKYSGKSVCLVKHLRPYFTFTLPQSSTPFCLNPNHWTQSARLGSHSKHKNTKNVCHKHLRPYYLYRKVQLSHNLPHANELITLYNSTRRPKERYIIPTQ